jgi:hypothetical protein
LDHAPVYRQTKLIVSGHEASAATIERSIHSLMSSAPFQSKSEQLQCEAAFIKDQHAHSLSQLQVCGSSNHSMM